MAKFKFNTQELGVINYAYNLSKLDRRTPGLSNGSEIELDQDSMAELISILIGALSLRREDSYGPVQLSYISVISKLLSRISDAYYLERVKY